MTPIRLRHFLLAAVLCLATTVSVQPASAGPDDGRLDIYFIDVEGGAATLIVTPVGESILIDSGYPDNNGRDRDRILDVVRNVAKLKSINHAVVSHWHLDHYGNHAALAAEIAIDNFWDRGIPDALREDPGFEERIANYRAATQNASRTLKAGDSYPLQSPGPDLRVDIVTASREVIANSGPPNPHVDKHKPAEEDLSDNAASISLLLTFGHFKFLCCGDLTWNVEAELVTPSNPLGTIDLFMVTHHGLPTSNNPVLVHAIDPTVAVMCNGPTKGGHEQTIATLQATSSLQHWYQLHRNINLADEAQAPAEFIANSEPTVNCEGIWIKASVAPDGSNYTVQIGPEGRQRTYHTRAK
jgi:competence protein ComEC